MQPPDQPPDLRRSEAAEIAALWARIEQLERRVDQNERRLNAQRADIDTLKKYSHVHRA